MGIVRKPHVEGIKRPRLMKALRESSRWCVRKELWISRKRCRKSYSSSLTFEAFLRHRISLNPERHAKDPRKTE